MNEALTMHFLFQISNINYFNFFRTSANIANNFPTLSSSILYNIEDFTEEMNTNALNV